MKWNYAAIALGICFVSFSVSCIIGWKAFVLTAMCSTGIVLIILGLSN